MATVESIRADGEIEKLAAVYAGQLDDMADLITAEMGSPRSFSRTGQAAGAAHMMHLAMATGREFPWAERRKGVLGEVHLHRAPVGVVGAIVPWNVPQFLIMPKLIFALIAGCPVIVKPAPETPLDAWRHAWATGLDATSDGGPGWREYLEQSYQHVWAKDFRAKEIYLGVRQRSVRAQLSGGVLTQFVAAYGRGERGLGLIDEAVYGAEISKWTESPNGSAAR